MEPTEPTTPTETKEQPIDSQILGVSVRAWITLILTLTVCGMAAAVIEVKEPLYSAFLLALGFYFGQKFTIQKSNQ